ncbi:MAG: 4Fe-4S binding protein [Chloroflexi bacterium]|nr:4Fe-4S binding protein [Chloroflexota bacterium]
MPQDLYQQLAHHLDNLPGGYPPTESGVELRILRRLFSPEEAELAMCLTVLPEEAKVVARRAHWPVPETAQMLQEMEAKGLIYAYHPREGLPKYSALHFVVGIWEFQVNRLTPELVRDFEEYLPTLAAHDVWQKAPQIRTIPVGQSIAANQEVMIYEQAEELVRSQKHIVVAPCICRQERQTVGEGCKKPLETCLSFGTAADYYQRNGLGREIDQEEALKILKQANRAGLVLQPSNSQKASFICCCCGDCCGVLRSAKLHPQPASVLASAFFAEVDAALCNGCGACTRRCQMDAVEMVAETAVLNLDRCIGCGLCVSTCPTKALALVRKPETDLPDVPPNFTLANFQLGRTRGKFKTTEMVMMVVRSKVDRLLS